MRKFLLIKLKIVFCSHLAASRMKLNMTQAQMAERLSMDVRSYIDLDHGKSACSAVTLTLFLIYVCTDVSAFLLELRKAFEKDMDKYE